MAQYLLINGMRRRWVVLVGAALLLGGGALTAESNVELSVTPAVRFGPLADQLQTEPAIGGSVSFGVRLAETPVRIAAGSGFYKLSIDDERFGSGYLVIPRAGLAWAPEFTVAELRLSTHVEVAYRHYFASYDFNGESYTAFRPIASAGWGAAIAVTDRVWVGPIVAYDVVFDDQPRSIVEVGLQTRLVW